MAEEADDKPVFPSAYEWFFEIGLYDAREYPAKFGSESLDQTACCTALTSFREKLDAHCTWCGRDSVFANIGGTSPASLFRVGIECSRNPSHKYFFYFFASGISLQKVGQYPAAADIAQGETLRFRKILTAGAFAELNRATGLYSHGVGIGSFVYLRRIFEDLVEDAYEAASGAGELTETADEYRRLRMPERIKVLRTHLPEVLVENAGMYAILSKGIHELSEAECKKAFPVVRAGIEAILDEILARREAQERRRRVTAEIARTKGEIEKADTER